MGPPHDLVQEMSPPGTDGPYLFVQFGDANGDCSQWSGEPVQSSGDAYRSIPRPWSTVVTVRAAGNIRRQGRAGCGAAPVLRLGVSMTAWRT